MVKVNPNGSVTINFFKGLVLVYLSDSQPRTSPPTIPAISDMTFWQLQDELDDLNRKLSLPPDLDGMGPEGRLDAHPVKRKNSGRT